MCKRPQLVPSPGDTSTTVDVAKGAVANNAAAAITWMPPFVQNLVQPPYSKRRVALLVLAGCLATCVLLFSSLYALYPGFRRTCQFWKGMAPLIARYKVLKFRGRFLGEEEYQNRLKSYRQRTAPKVVDLIQSLGGIYIKIGQVMSTIGQGLLPDEYVRALRPLQDGVPPRDYAQVARIIERSTGRKMGDIFESFDECPLGSASIAQAHRATLRPPDGGDGGAPEEVIVKVQYPEVAELFEADLSNLEIATKLFMPENMELVKALRERHENELDFTIEARNLRDCTRNMQAHGVEPSLVRIPRVKGIPPTKHVLVMEYLKGTSLADAIDLEQDRVAKALGKKDAEELRSTLTKRMREHFEQGGGAGSGGMEMLGGRKAKMVQVFTPLASDLLRLYARARERVEDGVIGLQNVGAHILKGVTGGKVKPRLKTGSEIRQKRLSKAPVNLARALKTLVHVHGLQMLKDGVYNADPHPGNVLVMPDGRLGLLDYGMVGHLSSNDRENIAKTIVALSRKDKAETAKLYRNAGYRATWKDGEIDDANVLHRFASFHLDRIDLSPLSLESGDELDIMELFRSTRERAVPSWVEEGRRLGGLLQGVSAQAARPISLAKEWEPIASQTLREKRKK